MSTWEPANDVERRLAAAVERDDLRAAMRVLATAPLFLPGFADPADGRQRMLAREREGSPYLLVFTSPEALRRTVDADGWRTTTLSELARSTPAGWGLAVNPASPVLVLVPPDRVADLMPTPASMAGFQPANEVERLLRDALVAPDAGLLLDVLVTAEVIVPTRALDVDGTLTVPAFTSVERYDAYFADRHLDIRTVTVDLVAVLRRWPGPAYTLAVNPGSPIAITLTGERVPELLAYASAFAHRHAGPRPANEAPAPVAAAGREPPAAPGDITDLLRGSG